MKEKKREDYIDNYITNFFDNLWQNNAYIDLMAKNLDIIFDVRKTWNKNLENILSFLQLPNQQMQQKILYNTNVLIAEWRFEQEELKRRLKHLEDEINALKSEKVTGDGDNV